MTTQVIRKFVLLLGIVLLCAGIPTPVPVIIGLPSDLYANATKRAKLCEILNWEDAGWKIVNSASDTNRVWYLYDVTETQIKAELTPEEKDKLKAVFNDSRAKFKRGQTLTELMKEYDFVYRQE